MTDTPVQPLTLFRLTLEMDDKDVFKFWAEVFKNPRNHLTIRDEEPRIEGLLLEHFQRIIGVETRIRERLSR